MGQRTKGVRGNPPGRAVPAKLRQGTPLPIDSVRHRHVVVSTLDERGSLSREVTVGQDWDSPDPGSAAATSDVADVNESGTAGIPLAQTVRAPVSRSPPVTEAFAHDVGADQLGTVVVTAQRRAEDLQSVPLAVVAATATDLLNAGVTNTASLSLAVPGLSYTLGGNAATPFIRGVGTTINSVGNEASVATYVDGVYISSVNALLFELNNIDRIEVLKGPQGTLFGRNATGGVIQIITKSPAFSPSADIYIGASNYDTTSGSFYGTTALGEHVAADLAVYGRNQANGWGTDLVTGQQTFTHHDFAGRSKLLWIPSDSTRVLIAADYNRTSNEDGLGFHMVPPGIGIDGVTAFKGFYNTFDNPNDHTDVRQSGLSLRLEQEFSAARLINITSWRNVNGSVLLDEDATPPEVVRAPYHQHDETVTEEVQLQSTGGASLPWIVGIYYLADSSAYNPLGLLGVIAEPLDEIQIWSTQKSNSFAVFGQVTPEVATGTHLTLGARGTRDHRAVTGSTIGLLGSETLTLAADSQSTSWRNLAWRVALDHQFTPDLMAYLSADRGFKSGVYNLVTYAEAPVNPETLDAYQLGVKTELAKHRLRVNTAVFFYDYRNLQVQEIVAGAISLVNAAAAEMRGIDVDCTFGPISSLTIRGGFEIISGHYTNFQNAPFYRPILGPNGEPVGGNMRTVGNASGLDTVRTPKGTAAVSAAYAVAVPRGNLNFVVGYYYNSGFAWEPDNRLRQSRYDVVNASIDWNSPGHAWSISLWGRNLTGTQYCAYETATTLSDLCAPAPPRTYGITLGAHF